MKALNQFAKKRLDRLEKLLNHFPDESAKEEVHKIRLEIKKIKALLRLIHFNNKDFRDHKHYIHFRHIFRETGEIRDRGLRQELVERYTQIATPFYRSPDRAVQQFIKAIAGHRKTLGKQKKIILKEIGNVKAHTYSLYLHKKNKELNHFLMVGIKQRDLHILRKLLKEIIYLTSVKTKKNKIDSFLTESAELIGNWHDKKVLIPWIRTHAPGEKETITHLQRECNSDLQALRMLIKNR